MSVAIRAITRVQDGDDMPVLGAGQDGYVLTWDNASGAFVATALFTGGLLATGATAGATSQSQAFTNGIIGPSWKPSADSTTALQLQNAAGTAVVTVDTTNNRLSLPFGVVYSGSSQLVRFDAVEANVFLGASGNASVSGANNTGIGRYALSSLTSGINNLGLGYGALYSNSAGSNNYAIGLMAMAYATDPTGVVAVGNYSGQYATGGNSVFIGHMAGNHETGTQRLYIDSFDRTDEATGRISSLLYGEFNSAVASQLLRVNGVLQPLMTDGVTAAVTNVLVVGHNSSGVPSVGFGSGQLFTLKSSTTTDQNAAAVKVLWNDATHATRKADLVLTAYDTSEREGLRIRGAGSAAAIGFLGAAPAARIAHVADPAGGATVDAEARSAINSILATLETFGLHATS